MGTLQKRYQKGLTWEGKVTAEVIKKLEDLSNASRRCTLIFAGGDEYEVLDENVHFVVNLQRRTCECLAIDWNSLQTCNGSNSIQKSRSRRIC